jgi:peptide/nickel transport system substrate-binding protein
VRYCLLFMAGGPPLLAACTATPAQPTAAPPPTAAPQPTTAPKPAAAAQPTAAPVVAAAAPTPTAAPAAAKPAAIAPQAVISAANDIESGDPHTNQALIYGNVIRLNVFSSLVRYGPNLEYVPDLAEKWENPDDTTYIFHLRQGAKYHNGQEVEASHVE